MPRLLTRTVASLYPAIRRVGGLRDPVSSTTYFFNTFSHDLILIGRDQCCDVPLAEQSVSKRHATLKLTRDGRAILRDHKSHNGTYVNQLRIDGPVELVAGMIIHLGSEALLLTTDERGNLPITAYSLPEYCYYAIQYYGSEREAERRIGKSRKLIVNLSNEWRQKLLDELPIPGSSV